MKVRIDDARRSGEVVDLRDCDHDLAPSSVAAAVREPTDDRIRCPEPGPAHRHVGCVTDDIGLDRRAGLAAVARSRGLTAPQDDELAAVLEELASLEAGTTDLAAARRRVAETADEQERLRERVATLRGRVQARREAGLDAETAADELAAAARELSGVETERAAAEQELQRAREIARSAYDRRERRLRLQDRRDNLLRAARSHLAETVRPDVHDALAALSSRADDPGEVAAQGGAADPVDVADPAFAMAAARVADLEAPMVVAWAPMGPRAVADWLGVPVVVL